MREEFAKKTITSAAKVYKIPLTKAECASFVKKLQAVRFLEMFNKMRRKTQGVVPTHHPTGLKNSFREDKIRESLSQDEALANAQRKHKGYFCCPYIFKE